MITLAMRLPKRAITTLFVLSAASAFGQAAQPAADTRSQLAEHIRLSQQYLVEKKPTKAIPELQMLLALDPDNVEAHANLGVLLFFQGQFAPAIPHLRAALALKPDLPKIRSLLGLAERRVGDDAAGRADLEAALPYVVDQKLKMDVGRDLIDSYVGSGQLSEAAAIVATLLKLEPTDRGLLYTSYRIHNDMAVEALLALGLVAPDSGQLHQAMAHELQRERDLPGAIANLRQALALDPSLPGIHFELAEALHASDDQRLRAEAVDQYKLAVQTAPEDVKAATRMGDVEVEKGDMVVASTYYRQALKVRANYPDANTGLANILSEQGDPAGAASLLEQVEVADPSNSLAHYRLSVVYRKLKRPDDVKRELELYQRYKDEHEKLQAVYKKMRVTPPATGLPK